MANLNRTDYEGAPLSGPGILWINSRITDPTSLPEPAFERWYEDIHIPDIIAARPGGVVASWQYRCQDPARPAPFLAVYRVPDMGYLQSAEFKAIPMVHPSLPGNGPIHRFADFDARFLAHVESWTKRGSDLSRSQMLVSEAIEPGDRTAAQIDQWYKETRIHHLSSLSGWRRTSRFKLVFKKENKDDPNSAKNITPTLLALHEFEAGSLEYVQQIMDSSEQTKEILSEAKKVDVAAFDLLRGFGEEDNCWVAEIDMSVV